MKIAVLCGLTLILAVGCHSGVRELDCFSAPTTVGIERAGVGCCNVCIPAGQFLLIRRGRFIAALRFSSLHRAATDALLGCAEYELHQRNDGILSFRDGRDEKTTGRVSRLESHGIHPFVVQDGAWRILVAGEFGSYGIFRLETITDDVPSPGTTHDGIGLHSGRDGMYDKAGRLGWNYTTKGCIRTTDTFMGAVANLAKTDPLSHLDVVALAQP